MKNWREDKKSLEDQLAESRDVAMRQKLSLGNKDQILGNLLKSTQVSEGLGTTERLTMQEEELNWRLEKELDVAHQSVNSEIDQRWEAEDKILHMQTEIDQVIFLFLNVRKQGF